MASKEAGATALHRAADAEVPRFVKAIHNGFLAGRRKASLQKLTAAFKQGDRAAIERIMYSAMMAAEDRLGELVPGVLMRGLEAGADAVNSLRSEVMRMAKVPEKPFDIGLTLKFDTKDQAAVDWARQHGAELVREVTDETRQAIQEQISKGLSQGIAPARSALVIRESVGLTARQAGAVDKLIHTLETSPGRRVRVGKQFIRVPKTGMPANRVQLTAARYAEKLRRQRALTIARTETIRASNEGQRQLWEQAVQRKLLSGNELREWVATDNERTCPICGEGPNGLDGKRATLKGAFEGGYLNPPAHPNCRCTTRLITVRPPKIDAPPPNPPELVVDPPLPPPPTPQPLQPDPPPIPIRPEDVPKKVIKRRPKVTKMEPTPYPLKPIPENPLEGRLQLPGNTFQILPTDQKAKEKILRNTREVYKDLNMGRNETEDIVRTVNYKRDFKVGDKSFTEGGHYNNGTNHIVINETAVGGPGKTDAGIRSIVAHELTHHQFNMVRNFHQSADGLSTDFRKPLVDKKFLKVINDNLAELVREDGVTGYSKAYWDVVDTKVFTYESGAMEIGTNRMKAYQEQAVWTAINETLAEISAVKYNPYESIKNVHPTWAKLRKQLQESYEEVREYANGRVR